jgi:putative SOS response-associated peptidase YedK
MAQLFRPVRAKFCARPVSTNNSRRRNRSPISHSDPAAARPSNQLRHCADPGRSRNPSSSRDWRANAGCASMGSDTELGERRKDRIQKINARVETVDTAPSYRQAFKKRRCLIPADGFYEWRKVLGGKIPYNIQMKDGRPFAFASFGKVGNRPGQRMDSDLHDYHRRAA